MATYTTTESTSWDRRTTFDYLAEFSNVSDWDPSIPDARRVSGEPRSEGSRYEVDFEMLGRKSTLDYEVLEVESPARIVLRSDAGPATSVDTLTFVDTGSGTEVTYDAEITFKGPLKLIDPLFALAFNRVGGKAARGLRERLAAAPPATATQASTT